MMLRLLEGPRLCIAQHIADQTLLWTITGISDLNTKLPLDPIYEECLTSFDSEQALKGHFEYSKLEGKAPAGYNNSKNMAKETVIVFFKQSVD